MYRGGRHCVKSVWKCNYVTLFLLYHVNTWFKDYLLTGNDVQERCFALKWDLHEDFSYESISLYLKIRIFWYMPIFTCENMCIIPFQLEIFLSYYLYFLFTLTWCILCHPFARNTWKLAWIYFNSSLNKW